MVRAYFPTLTHRATSPSPNTLSQRCCVGKLWKTTNYYQQLHYAISIPSILYRMFARLISAGETSSDGRRPQLCKRITASLIHPGLTIAPPLNFSSDNRLCRLRRNLSAKSFGTFKTHRGGHVQCGLDFSTAATRQAPAPSLSGPCFQLFYICRVAIVMPSTNAHYCSRNRKRDTHRPAVTSFTTLNFGGLLSI